jgi:serine/threonine-protein kinase
VLTVDPAEGTSLKQGETVTLVPSLGPPPVKVPDVRGDTLQAASDALHGSGLVVASSIHEAYSDTVAEGHVIRQSPADGRAPKGSAVTLWVSKGRAPVAVPRVVGATQAAAEKALREAGFKPVVAVAYSQDIERGKVISVDPSEAAKTPYGSPVTITVSQGPETFPVPTLTGLSPAEARAKARSYGLAVAFSYVPGTAQTIVISQIPTAGTEVHAGDTITLWVAG